MVGVKSEAESTVRKPCGYTYELRYAQGMLAVGSVDSTAMVKHVDHFHLVFRSSIYDIGAMYLIQGPLLILKHRCGVHFIRCEPYTKPFTKSWSTIHGIKVQLNVALLPIPKLRVSISYMTSTEQCQDRTCALWASSEIL